MEYLKQKQREYAEKNADKIKEYSQIKIQCECGTILTKVKLSRHLTCKKHQDFIKHKQDFKTDVF